MLKSCVKILDGSGFFAAKNYILTCRHVIEGHGCGEEIAWHSDNQSGSATIEEIAEDVDLALLRSSIDAPDGEYLQLDRVTQIGDTAIAYGYPANSDRQSNAPGVVIGDEISTGELMLGRANDVRLGYSGGPILYPVASKTVVAVVSAISRTELSENAGYLRGMEGAYCIPAKAALSRWSHFLCERRSMDPPESKNTLDYRAQKANYQDNGYLALLNSFLDDRRRVLWWAIIGEDGAGKSRLALEFALSMTSEWRSVFLRPSDLTINHLDRLFRQAGRNLLIVADYAYTQTGALGTWLQKQAYDSSQKYKCRVLLLQRKGSKSQGQSIPAWEISLLKGHRDILSTLHYDNDLILSANSKANTITIMRTYIKNTYGDADSIDYDLLYNELERIDPTKLRPLLALYIADAVSRGGYSILKSLDKDSIKKSYCDRELSLLDDVITDLNLLPAAELLWVLATICGRCNLNIEQLRAFSLSELRELDEEGKLPQLRDMLLRSHAEDRGSLQAMTPDPFGEYFVFTYFRQHPDRIADIVRSSIKYSDRTACGFFTRFFADCETDRALVIACCGDLSSTELQDAISWGLVIRADAALLKSLSESFDTPLWLKQYGRGLVNQLTDPQASTIQDTERLDELKLLFRTKSRGIPELKAIYADGLLNLLWKAPFNPKRAASLIEDLRVLYQDNPKDPEIALIYAKGLYNYIHDQSDSGEIEEALDRLYSLYRDTDSKEVLVVYASGLFDFFLDQRCLDEAQRVVDEIEELFINNQHNQALAVIYAKCLYNHIFNLLEPSRIREYLDELRSISRNEPEASVWYARGLYSQIRRQSDLAEAGDLLNELDALYKIEPDTAPILAEGIFCLFNKQTDPFVAQDLKNRLEVLYTETKDKKEIEEIKSLRDQLNTSFLSRYPEEKSMAC